MSEEKSIFGELYDKFFGQPIPMWIGSILIAGMSVGLFLLAQPFGASCAIVNWGQNLYGWNVSNGGAALDTLYYKCAMGCLTLMLGAMGAAFMARQWSLRIAPPGELIKGIIGGVFMAFGAVLGKGCTLGSFFSGWAALSGGALVFAGGLALGAFLGAKYLLWEVDKHPGISTGKSFDLGFGKGNKFIQPIIGILIIALGLAFPFIFGYDMTNQTHVVVVGFIVISVFIGIIIQRSRWCVVRALREPWMSGDSTAAVAIMAGILVGMIGMAAYKFSYGLSTDIDMVFVFPHFWVRGLIGGTLFGFGMTVAGGCAVGSMWRAAEGQVKLLLSLITMVLVMPFVARDIVGPFTAALPEGISLEKVYMPDVLGYGGAIALFVGIIGLWYWFVKWNDRTGKFAAI